MTDALQGTYILKKWVNARWFERELDDLLLAAVHGTFHIVTLEVGILALHKVMKDWLDDVSEKLISVTYLLNELICTIFLKLGVKKAAVSDHD